MGRTWISDLLVPNCVLCHIAKTHLYQTTHSQLLHNWNNSVTAVFYKSEDFSITGPRKSFFTCIQNFSRSAFFFCNFFRNFFFLVCLFFGFRRNLKLFLLHFETILGTSLLPTTASTSPHQDRVPQLISLDHRSLQSSSSCLIGVADRPGRANCFQPVAKGEF